MAVAHRQTDDARCPSCASHNPLPRHDKADYRLCCECGAVLVYSPRGGEFDQHGAKWMAAVKCFNERAVADLIARLA